jgi:hypothetical protein
MIGDFTGNDKAKFPFSLAMKPDQNIYSPECAPENFVLSDPDHLPLSKVNQLYYHWLTRQNKGLPPFIILNPNPIHRRKMKKTSKAKNKGKKKADWVDVTSDDEDGLFDDVDDVEDVEIAKVKIGPPKRMGKRNDQPNAIAGSSKLPSMDNPPNDHPPNETKTRKRKADQDLGGQQDKRAKTDGSTTKRKLDEPAESPVSPKKSKSS